VRGARRVVAQEGYRRFRGGKEPYWLPVVCDRMLPEAAEGRSKGNANFKFDDNVKGWRSRGYKGNGAQWLAFFGFLELG
jgi:hypothetical protein